MTPEELAKRHPRLYHITEPGAWQSIQKHGLLSTSSLLDLFEIAGARRKALETERRPASVLLEHPTHGQVILNDNVPLTEKALKSCLDDNLSPSDWLLLLNARVFFWSSREALDRHLAARLNRTRQRQVLVVDTLSLAKAHASRIDLSPINTGSTIRKPARRGLTTFTPMLKYPFNEWSKLRGGRDHILEVTVKDHVLDITQHTLDILLR